jgi:hypothetical protein
MKSFGDSDMVVGWLVQAPVKLEKEIGVRDVDTVYRAKTNLRG